MRLELPCALLYSRPSPIDHADDFLRHLPLFMATVIVVR
jgi:hypothetical protein